MPYVATINSNSPQALNLVNYLKTFEFIDVAEQEKATKSKSQTALAQPEFEEETPEQYELIMALSKETNRAIARKINKIKNLNLPL